MNFVLIYCNQKTTNNTSTDDDDDLIENLINNIDKIFSDIIDELDIENNLIENEIIIDEDLNDYNFNFEDILNENENENGFEDIDDDESIWPERPIPRYKNIV